MLHQLVERMKEHDVKALARSISLVENEADGFEQLLQKIQPIKTKLLGITGPPGAGKSTLVNAMIERIISSGKTVGVLCIDPSSPFNFGALLGDRIRMNQWYNHPGVFIRSLAARGSLGGLHPNIIEITELMKSFGFDYVIVETVGVGQSEVEIAGLADITIVALSPEAGDEIQTMKAGIMEIADIFVVNKADRPEVNSFVNNLKSMVAHSANNNVPVIKTIASQNEGIEELLQSIAEFEIKPNNERKYLLYAEKAFRLIQKRRMKSINKSNMMADVKQRFEQGDFNLFDFANSYK
jgi:LAO/AO transport system kinase